MKKQLIIFFSLFFVVQVFAQTELAFPHPERIKYDANCLQIEGKDAFVYSGAFHYFRVPKALWKDRFQKIKEVGFNGVETYVPWNYHERNMPKKPGDYSQMDLTELEEWIKMAEEFGFYIIIRPGPYICAEWDGGGFPQWLVSEKKPKNLSDKVWLQTIQPDFMAWNKHWYEAVCKVVAPHQITKKAVGAPGVILFQIENEYERIKFIPRDEKKKYLEELTVIVKDAGIEVPVFTCWTKESRGVTEGPLVGVYDFQNFYPRWNVKNRMTKGILAQRTEQAYAPQMSAELQGGWYSEVGGKLSKDIDGVSAVQTQNITLYTLQMGFSLLNYYMFVGGTNFDDWASRETTTTYDFYASIRENGGVDEKYRRVQGIASMLKEHGTTMVRSELVDIKAEVSDTLVEVALRKGKDGSRFFYVRTEDRKQPRSGNIKVTETNGEKFSFDFALEPFGSMIYYLPAKATNKTAGTWYPKLPQPMVRPTDLPEAIQIAKVESHSDVLPQKWTKLKVGENVEKYGLYDRHFIYYKASVPAGKSFEVGRIGEKVANNSRPDGVLAMVNGKRLKPTAEDKEKLTFVMPAGGKEVIFLFENRGLHHHTNLEIEKHWNNGIKYVKVDGKELPLQFASVEKQRGLDFSSANAKQSKVAWKAVDVKADSTVAENEMLTWSRFTFELPEKKAGVWVPWKLLLNAKGNGFVYLNGVCIGRTWEVGPQREFFMPECWLNFGKGQINTVTVSLRPIDKGTNISEIAIVPDNDWAEFR